MDELRRVPYHRSFPCPFRTIEGRTLSESSCLKEFAFHALIGRISRTMSIVDNFQSEISAPVDEMREIEKDLGGHGERARPSLKTSDKIIAMTYVRKIFSAFSCRKNASYRSRWGKLRRAFRQHERAVYLHCRKSSHARS